MVTKTSVAAYFTITADATKRVGEFMRQRTLQGQRTTDADIAAGLHIPKSTAAARRNDLLKEGFFYEKDGHRWRPVLGSVTYDRQSRKTVQSWEMKTFED